MDQWPKSIFVGTGEPGDKTRGFQIIARGPEEFSVLCYGNYDLTREQINRLGQGIKDLLFEVDMHNKQAQEEQDPADTDAETPQEKPSKKKKAKAATT